MYRIISIANLKVWQPQVGVGFLFCQLIFTENMYQVVINLLFALAKAPR